MRCEIKHCRGESILNYMGKEICEKHWQKHCNDNEFDLAKEFNLVFTKKRLKMIAEAGRTG